VAAASRPRRSLLVPAVLVSAGVHLAVAAMLWVEHPPQPEAGTAVAIEIVPEAGVVSASRPNSAANPGGNPTPAAKPAATPQPQPPSEPLPPRASGEPPAVTAPSTLPPPRQAMTAPEIAAEAPTVRPPLRRATDARPAPTRTPTAAAPNLPVPKLALPKTAAPPARAAATPPRPQTASVPIVAADVAPGAGPDSGATPPRYGFGSAANRIPRYPEDARERGWEGVVVLNVSVGADGRADSVRVSRGSGHAVLDHAAADAVRRWRFEPARRAGMPVAAAVDVPIRFRLED